MQNKHKILNNEKRNLLPEYLAPRDATLAGLNNSNNKISTNTKKIKTDLKKQKTQNKVSARFLVVLKAGH